MDNLSGQFKQNAMKTIISLGHEICNFSLYPRFSGVLDPDEKRRLSIENSVDSLPQNILPFPRFS